MFTDLFSTFTKFVGLRRVALSLAAVFALSSGAQAQFHHHPGMMPHGHPSMPMPYMPMRHMHMQPFHPHMHPQWGHQQFHPHMHPQWGHQPQHRPMHHPHMGRMPGQGFPNPNGHKKLHAADPRLMKQPGGLNGVKKATGPGSTLSKPMTNGLKKSAAPVPQTKLSKTGTAKTPIGSAGKMGALNGNFPGKSTAPRGKAPPVKSGAKTPASRTPAARTGKPAATPAPNSTGGRRAPLAGPVSPTSFFAAPASDPNAPMAVVLPAPAGGFLMNGDPAPMVPGADEVDPEDEDEQ